MPSPNKIKGNNFEREIVNTAKEAGLNAKRAYASDGRSLGHSETVDLIIENYRIQAKRRKKLASYLQIPKDCDAVVFRQDRGNTLVLITLEQFIEICQKCKD